LIYFPCLWPLSLFRCPNCGAQFNVLQLDGSQLVVLRARSCTSSHYKAVEGKSRLSSATKHYSSVFCVNVKSAYVCDIPSLTRSKLEFS
jgi:hypothetical protein